MGDPLDWSDWCAFKTLITDPGSQHPSISLTGVYIKSQK